MRHYLLGLTLLGFSFLAFAQPTANDREMLLDGASLFLGEWKCAPETGIHPFTVRFSWTGDRGFELAWTTSEAPAANVYVLNATRLIALRDEAVFKSYHGKMSRVEAEHSAFRVEVLLFKPAVFTDRTDARVEFKLNPAQDEDALQFQMELAPSTVAGPRTRAEAVCRRV